MSEVYRHELDSIQDSVNDLEHKVEMLEQRSKPVNDDAIDAVVEAAAKAAFEARYSGIKWEEEPASHECWRNVAKAVILAVSQHEVVA